MPPIQMMIFKSGHTLPEELPSAALGLEQFAVEEASKRVLDDSEGVCDERQDERHRVRCQ